MIGTTISHYRILEKLGEGGMGVVYRAEDARLGRPVALKFLPDGVTSDPAARERFTREAQLVSSLEHQNICTVHEIDETDDGRLFIVMPCYEGESLRDTIARGPLPVNEAVKIALQIARGLDAAHEAGVFHRDVKPGNVVVSERGHVRLVDFGLAKLSGQTSVTRRGSAVGTVAYMSPEQSRGEDPGAPSDIWSLGAVVYEMVTGVRPFDGDTEQAVMRAIQRDRETPLLEARPDAPPELGEIVAKALSKSPSGRYRTMGEMLEDLRTLARQLEVTDPGRTDTWRFVQARERRLRLAAFASAGVVVALIALWGWRSIGQEAPVPRGIPMQVTSGEGAEWSPAISPDGGRVAYALTDGGNADIYVMDVVGGRTLQLTDDPALDFAPAWTPDGTAIVFTSERSGERCLWQVGQFGGSATMLLENAEYPAVSPDGTRIAFSRAGAESGLRVWVAPFDTPSDARMLTGAEHGLWDQGQVAWSPDGRRLCYGSPHDLWVVDADGGEPRRLTTDGQADGDPAWSSDGRYVYFESWREGTLALWRVNSSGGTPVRMTEGTGSEGEPSVSLDGSRLAYSTGGFASGTVRVNLSTGEEAIVSRMRVVGMPAVSPDGSRMVYISKRWDHRNELAEQLFVDGEPYGPPRRLTDQEGNASHPTYSPDGKWIAYYQILGEERDIWVVPTTGGLPSRITSGGGQDIHPFWSPDGSRLAYVSGTETSYDIWVVSVEEGRPVGEPRRVSDGSVRAFAPVWSPDGSELAFIGSTGELDVWAVAADGMTPPRRLTRGLGAARLRWDALSRRILTSGTTDDGRRVLWSISPEDGAGELFEPSVVFGTETALGHFDVSRDGSTLVYSRQSVTGDIWISEGQPGLF